MHSRLFTSLAGLRGGIFAWVSLSLSHVCMWVCVYGVQLRFINLCRNCLRIQTYIHTSNDYTYMCVCVCVAVGFHSLHQIAISAAIFAFLQCKHTTCMLCCCNYTQTHIHMYVNSTLNTPWHKVDVQSKLKIKDIQANKQVSVELNCKYTDIHTYKHSHIHTNNNSGSAHVQF